MQLEFYNLRQQPFGVTPDPRFIYFSAAHERAFAAMMTSVNERRGFSAMIAKPGMGKTSLLLRLLAMLKDSARTGFLFQTQGDSKEVLTALLHDLEAGPCGHDVSSMQESLNAIIARESKANRQDVIVVDEAQNLSEDAFESLRLLSNFERPDAKLLHIVLAGQPGLAQKLSSPQLAQLRQRLSVVAEIPPFTLAQTIEYVDHRLRVAGYQGQDSLFTAAAFEFIAQASEGTPRLVNNICFHALTLGAAAGKFAIDLPTVREASRFLELERGSYTGFEPVITESPLEQVPSAVGRPAPEPEPVPPLNPSSAASSEEPPQRSTPPAVPAWATIPSEETSAAPAEIPSFSYGPRRRRTGLSALRICAALLASSALIYAGYEWFGAKIPTGPIQTRLAEIVPAWAYKFQRSVAAAPALTPVSQRQPDPPVAAPASTLPDTAPVDRSAPQPSADVKPFTEPVPLPANNAAENSSDEPKAATTRRSSRHSLTEAQPTTVRVKRTQTLFQFAMEHYGKADHSTVARIKLANPQIHDAYEVLEQGQQIRLPAPPTTE